LLLKNLERENGMKLLKQNVIPLKNVKIDDGFWNRYQRLVKEEILPYQYLAINDQVPDVEPSHAIKNFKIAAGLEEGEYYGYVFQDTDVYKWIEAVAYTLVHNRDEELEKKADEIIDLIEKAQQKDGYLVTYFIIKEPDKRFTNLLDCHELYSLGHMIEGAVAYYEATGKDKFLKVACRFADLVDKVIGPEEGKLHGYCGHPEIELALVKLYRVTKNEKYLNLCKYMIDERGKEPHFFDIELEKRNHISHWGGRQDKVDKYYNQSHKPVREQDVAVGHTVRAGYLYTGMADLACETGDVTLLEAAKRLWDNVTTKQMYITGGIGSMAGGEAFSFDYHLPNDTVYAETCAAISLAFFAQRMLKMENDSKYADVLERTLYNGIISGMQLDGKHFFYVNPLEVWEKQNLHYATYHHRHVRTKRPGWFGCACCPPNLARLIASLGEYIYTQSEDTIYVNLYIGNNMKTNILGKDVEIKFSTNYPWGGESAIEVSKGDYKLALRIPEWCENYTILKNGKKADYKLQNGYAVLDGGFCDGDKIEISFDMPVTLVEANPQVREDAGKYAITRGPIVYCLESADNGENLWAIRVDENTKFTHYYDENFLGGCVVIKGEAVRVKEWTENKLYRKAKREEEPFTLTAIPYAFWSNREDTREMKVFITGR